MNTSAKHGGLRKGAGRKARSVPKAKPIWCGQISHEDREFIMKMLSPDERFRKLMTAALAAKQENPDIACYSVGR